MRASMLLAACALAIASLASGDAAGRSCISHAYEHMELRRLDVRERGALVEAPASLPAFDQLLNSGERGKSVLLWEHEGDWSAGAKWFASREAIEPSATQAAYIEASASRVLQTSCGYPVVYTPILAGRYTFKEDHTGGATSQGIDARTVTVSADRQRVHLEFVLAEQRYTATYEVTCAYFDWGEGRQCGPKEEHVDAPFLSAVEAAADDPPPPEPPRIDPPPPRDPEPPAHAEPIGCAIAGSGFSATLALGGLALLLASARRRRQR